MANGEKVTLAKVLRVYQAYGPDGVPLDQYARDHFPARLTSGDLSAPGRGLPELRAWFVHLRKQAGQQPRAELLSMAIEFRERIALAVLTVVAAWYAWKRFARR